MTKPNKKIDKLKSKIEFIFKLIMKYTRTY